MKSLLSLLALALLIAGIPAWADGNGVERGDINITPNSQVPKGVEDKIESTMFENCDFRGADKITATFFSMDQDESAQTNDYQLQYEVDFDKDGRKVMISVHAVLHLTGGPDSVEIKDFESPICKTYP